MQFIIEHKDAILVSLLLLSEGIGLWTPAGGFIDAIVGVLKQLGAKNPQ